LATYVISDIHGEYDKFIRMLDKINFSDEDTLYILGDVVDRGPNPVQVLLKLMSMHNVVPIVGNHELMAMECLSFLENEITEETIDNLSPQDINNLVNWLYNGCATTLAEFKRLDPEMKHEVSEFIKDFALYEEVQVVRQSSKPGRRRDKIRNGETVRYLLVHAGLGNYSPKKCIVDYSLKEIVWDRADYNVPYYPRRKNFFVISGHTPTELIEDNPNPGYIYRKNNHIAIDCGACFKGGRLAAICLETDEEFYID
jgi:serine/threonine protein phosphatase 1